MTTEINWIGLTEQLGRVSGLYCWSVENGFRGTKRRLSDLAVQPGERLIDMISGTLEQLQIMIRTNDEWLNANQEEM